MDGCHWKLWEALGTLEKRVDARVSVKAVRAPLAGFRKLFWGYGDEKEEATTLKKKKSALNQLLDFKPRLLIHKQAGFCR